MEKFVKDILTKSLEARNKKMTSLEMENVQLRTKLDEVENLSRLNNVVIHGLPEPNVGKTTASSAKSRSNQSSIPEIIELCTARLHLHIDEPDISFAYRIPGKGKYRPLVVGLSHRRARDAIYDSRKLLRNMSNSDSPTIYINEHLTRMNSQLYAKARSLVKARKIHSTWTAGGRLTLQVRSR